MKKQIKEPEHIPTIKRLFPNYDFSKKQNTTLMSKKEVKMEYIRFVTLQEGDPFNFFFLNPLGIYRLQFYKLFLLKNKEDALALYVFYMLESEKDGPMNNQECIIDYKPKKHIKEMKWTEKRYLETKKILLKAGLLKDWNEGKQIKLCFGMGK